MKFNGWKLFQSYKLTSPVNPIVTKKFQVIIILIAKKVIIPFVLSNTATSYFWV